MRADEMRRPAVTSSGVSVRLFIYLRVSASSAVLLSGVDSQQGSAPSGALMFRSPVPRGLRPWLFTFAAPPLGSN